VNPTIEHPHQVVGPGDTWK